MSPDFNSSKLSAGSFIDSATGSFHDDLTVSDFDPENEAIMSTRQIKSTPDTLPELRASAKKYKNYRPESDFVINTSAIGRAFPDFTQGSEPPEPEAVGEVEDESISIEVGRGLKRGNGPVDDVPYEGLEDSILPRFKNNNAMASSPPVKKSSSSRHERRMASSLKKETHSRQATRSQKDNSQLPQASKTADYGSTRSRRTTEERRRPVAELHQQVADEEETSFADVADDGRPSTVTLTTKNTRFASGTNRVPAASGGLPTRFTSAESFAQQLNNDSSRPQARGNANSRVRSNNTLTGTATGTTTQQSWGLPNVEGLSELFSVYDGTPLAPRQSARRSSRFVSGANGAPTRKGPSHVPISEVPVPDDENAIYMSLKILQDKLHNLEHDNADKDKTIDDLQGKVRKLKDEKKERERNRRSDSALGLSDDREDNDSNGGPKRIRLESTVKVLENRLESASRKAAVSESLVQRLTKERDSYVQQLGATFTENEELQIENEELREEIQRLKDILSQTVSQKRSSRARANTQPEEVTSRSEAPTRSFNKRKEKRDTTEANRDTTQTRNTESQDNVDQVTDGIRSNTKSSKSNQASSKEGKKRRFRKVIVEEIYSSDESDPEPTKDGTKTRAKEQVSKVCHYEKPVEGPIPIDDAQNLTNISNIEDVFISQIQRRIEEERRNRRGDSRSKSENATKEITREITENTTKSKRAAKAMPKAGILRNRSRTRNEKRSQMVDMDDSSDGGFVDQIGATINEDEMNDHTEMTSGNKRQNHTQDSVVSNARRRRHAAAEMTSAFLLPDLTMKVPSGTDELPEFSPRVQHVLDTLLPKHDTDNCTVCKNLVPHKDCKSKDATEKSINLPRLVPVSERMPEPGPYEEEPTIRPSQPPTDALESVLKSLQDELSHLRIKKAAKDVEYHKLDVSLGWRRRKAMEEELYKLIKAIEGKSDQIYRLYDVLEGLKKSGREINDEEVDNTLENIGIDPARMRGLHSNIETGRGEASKGRGIRSLPADVRDKAFLDAALAGLDQDDDLPWDGIEDTIETTRRTAMSAH
ncbi:MAG: hypothetical protein M1834_006780 [Cirrosporium novae-zelandiae]|nr:MAG: hypothetical protein M1834_006780 [Cirrosporium novae-zelandiae]